MSRLIMLLGNGFTIDLISQLEKNDEINTVNLFANGDLVEWPDGQYRKGFLSYRNCKNLWDLGARPYMNDNDAQQLIEDIISCANTLTRTRYSVKHESVYRQSYYELIAYLKHLFIMYNEKVSDACLVGDKINEWGWYQLINKACSSERISEIDIVTYNYDIFLERVLKLHHLDFDIAGITDAKKKIKIYKPHGSISFCHKNMADKSMYSIRMMADMYEAKLSDFEVKYKDLNENYYVDAMIPPSGDSSRMTFQWAKEIRNMVDEMVGKVSADDKLVVSGLSYWHVDRREIDEILVGMPPEIEVYLVNPNPPKSLEAVISCIFNNFILFSNSKNIGGIII